MSRRPSKQLRFLGYGLAIGAVLAVVGIAVIRPPMGLVLVSVVIALVLLAAGAIWLSLTPEVDQ